MNMKKIKLFVAFFLLITFSMFSQNKKFETYTVQQGETLQSIARKFSVTPYSLIQLNPELSNTTTLKGGELLIVPNKNYKAEEDPSVGKDYVENGFLIHTVLPKENFYRLRKEYGASKRDLRKHNPVLRSEDLKVGQVLKIPVDRDFKIEGVENQVVKTKPYIVKPKEAKYGISKRYGITIEKFEELNPQTKGRALKMAELIVVPDTEEIPAEEKGFIIHRIEKGDNYFQFKQKFGVTKEQLIAINPVLEEEGLELGLLIKIPKIAEAITTVFIPQIAPEKELKAVLMLPFMSNKSTVDFEKSITSDIATDFYLGAMMALDSLKKQGLSIDLKVFDTQNNRTLVSSYLVRNNFADTDVVIGPLFFGNVEFVSRALQNRNIPIVSPVSQKDHTNLNNTHLIQDTPSDDKLMDVVLDYIKDNYKGQHIVVFSDTTKAMMPQLMKTLKVLEPLDSLTKIEIIKPEKGYFKPELFREKIKEKKDNIVILVTENNVVTTDVVQNLGVLPEKTNATLFAFKKGANFNNIDNNYLARIKFHYPTSTFIDFENREIQKFSARYKQKNYVTPSEYAFKGFDVTYDALIRFATHDEISGALNAGYSERTSTKYQFESNGFGKGFVNNGVYLVKYDGLHIVKVEEKLKEASPEE
tara:strand:- start:151975 stop:153903 length:1929 start_codon:yes stop_codon:yes gene_type:complete